MAGKGRTGAVPSLGRIYRVGCKGLLSQITPCCLLLGMSCYSTKNLSKTIWESKYFLITASCKLLFAVNGRKWEKQ